jgi:hypothetical protein
MAEQADPGARTCPWCSAPVAAADTKCPSCGAAVAQREDLGGILIPGVTGLAPGLEAIRDQPTHIKGPSPSQGLATGIIPAAALGGPAGLAVLGGIAAVTAVEYLSAKGPHGERVDPSTVGELGGVAQLALEKLEREGALAPDPAPGTEPEPALDPNASEPPG